MKILIGHFGHEANTFASQKFGFEQFASRVFLHGEEAITANEGTSSYSGGIIQAGREEGVEMIPTCAYTCAAPVLTRECVDKMLSYILPVAEAHKDELDGICISLHGAGVFEDDDDLESYVLRKLREIVGNEMPITSSLDLHGNISEEMCRLSNGLFGIRKYPHTDKFDAAYLAMKTLIRIIRGEIKPETCVCRLPLLIPIAAGMTANEPFVSIEKHFKEYIREKGLIDASFFQGFPYADVPSCGASVVVVAEKGAKEAAHELAKYVWEKRHELDLVSLSPAEALDLAEKEEKEGLIVINEMSDNPGGGTPGDGTHLLREMIKRDLPRSIFGYIVDEEAVEELFRHKPGDVFDITVGGKTEAIYGEPLELKNVKLISLTDDIFYHTSPNLRGVPAKLGKGGRIRHGNVDIIIGTSRSQTFDDRPFLVAGADVFQYRYAGLKSTQHFRSYFEPRCARIISTDPPGYNTSNLSVFEYKKLQRPVFPLDQDVTFE